MKGTLARATTRRSFRLEFLEERKVPSVAKPAAVAAEVVRPALTTTSTTLITSIAGQVSGWRASNGLVVGTPPGDQSFSGHGRATPVGTVYLGALMTETFDTAVSPETVTISNGTAILTTIHGSKIDLFYAGSGTVSSKGKTTVTVQGIVNSGTSPFDGVTGSFSASGTVSAQGRFKLNFTIRLTYPTVT